MTGVGVCACLPAVERSPQETGWGGEKASTGGGQQGGPPSFLPDDYPASPKTVGSLLFTACKAARSPTHINHVNEMPATRPSLAKSLLPPVGYL